MSQRYGRKACRKCSVFRGQMDARLNSSWMIGVSVGCDSLRWFPLPHMSHLNSFITWYDSYISEVGKIMMILFDSLFEVSHYFVEIHVNISKVTGLIRSIFFCELLPWLFLDLRNTAVKRFVGRTREEDGIEHKELTHMELIDTQELGQRIPFKWGRRVTNQKDMLLIIWLQLFCLLDSIIGLNQVGDGLRDVIFLCAECLVVH